MVFNDIHSLTAPKVSGSGEKCEIRISQQRYKNGRQEIVVNDGLEPDLFDEDNTYALVAEKIFNVDNTLEKSYVQINSPYLLKMFHQIVESYPTVPSDFEEPFELENLQYTTQVGHSWLLTVSKTAYEENKKHGKWFEVHCTYTDYDGANIGLAKRIFKIYQKKNFAAENPAVITGLQVFPRKFLKGRDGLESELQERGNRFLQLQGVLVKMYEGLVQYLKDPPMDFYDPEMADWPGVWLPYTEAGRVIIDRKSFQEENYLEQVVVNPYRAGEDEQSSSMQCLPFAYGLSLARKEWCIFYIDQMCPVEWNENLFNSLVIGDSQKFLLQALVTSHTFLDMPRDQPQQKGRGLVILLHGTPGSGKTLTAESAAEMTGKALFSTTMGELNKGNRPWYFERRLKEILEYPTIWKAIVVLDEADVFLEARQDTPSDGGERNALVAVFLHHLEYFSGIVFLTSNQVNIFDLAMKSRIHLVIEYSPPELQTRRMIWKQCFEAIPSTEISIDLNEAVDKLIKDEINGREVANAVNTAKTLARFEAQPLQMRHIETVLQVKRDFDRSIAKKRKAIEIAELRQGPLIASNRKNSILVSQEEPSEWLP